MFNFEIFSLVRGIRSLCQYLWCDRTDPFGRRCQILEAIDHPDHHVDNNTTPDGHFLQIDVAVRDKDCCETSKVLLWSSRQGKDLHLLYVFSASATGYDSFARTVFGVIQPWMEHQYEVVSDKYSFVRS